MSCRGVVTVTLKRVKLTMSSQRFFLACSKEEIWSASQEAETEGYIKQTAPFFGERHGHFLPDQPCWTGLDSLSLSLCLPILCLSGLLDIRRPLSQRHSLRVKPELLSIVVHAFNPSIWRQWSSWSTKEVLGYPRLLGETLLKLIN